ncbi:MAG: aldehyde dehydrogenase [Thermoplasmata archaeon]|nr:aldehyde dehydrogenase [Thermoplasmata archaeon]
MEVSRPPPTSREDLDKALEAVTAHKGEWVDLPIGERLDLVRRVRKDFRSVQQRWSDLSVAAKGIDERTLGNDREWMEIACINRTHFVTERALKDIQRYGKPKVYGGYSTRPNGQVVAHTYPDSRAHRYLFQGTTEEVWLEPGVTMEEAKARQAIAYNGGVKEGRLALVLGAGNASPLLTSDVFHMMFHDLRAVVLKMNPVNSYLGPLLEEAYRGLIERGFLRVVHGGAGEGRYLVDHSLVDLVHMTGSDRTFEAVVFGPGEEGARRKSEGAPLVDKPISGELGCITPWVVVPGDWSQKEVEEQAAKLAFWMMRHEGYICFAPRVLVVHKQWRQRDAFLEALIDALSRVEPIMAYYPGSLETQQIFVEAHPNAVQIGGGLEDRVPWTVIRDVDPRNADDICFCRESFSGMVAETALDAGSVPEYLARTVEFLNGTVWGTLSATLLVSPESMADPATGEAVERAIADLRYGSVALNATAVWGFYTMVTPWGAFPGSDIDDIQSGRGKVANFLMLHRPEKSVIRVPFHMDAYPFMGTAKDLDVFSRKLARFEEGSSWLQLPGLYMSARRSTPKR